jgi:hypothetical protein
MVILGYLKINGLSTSLDSKLTATSNLDAGKIINWSNVINNAIDINKVNNLQSQLDAKTGNPDPILLSRITGLEGVLDDKLDVTGSIGINQVTTLQSELDKRFSKIENRYPVSDQTTYNSRWWINYR